MVFRYNPQHLCELLGFATLVATQVMLPEEGSAELAVLDAEETEIRSGGFLDGWQFDAICESDRLVSYLPQEPDASR